jgi:hypothetical protein
MGIRLQEMATMGGMMAKNQIWGTLFSYKIYMKHDRTEAMLRMLFRSNECDSVHYET